MIEFIFALNQDIQLDYIQSTGNMYHNRIIKLTGNAM